MTRNGEAMRNLFANFGVAAHVVAQPGIFPDYVAPNFRNEGEAVPMLTMSRWGMPNSRKAILDAATMRADKLRAKNKPVDFDQLIRMHASGDSGICCA
jgi:hypothetical protein